MKRTSRRKKKPSGCQVQKRGTEGWGPKLHHLITFKEDRGIITKKKQGAWEKKKDQTSLAKVWKKSLARSGSRDTPPQEQAKGGMNPQPTRGRKPGKKKNRQHLRRGWNPCRKEGSRIKLRSWGERSKAPPHTKKKRQPKKKPASAARASFIQEVFFRGNRMILKKRNRSEETSRKITCKTHCNTTVPIGSKTTAKRLESAKKPKAGH